jgi:opacity protein-like surface antigen
MIKEALLKKISIFFIALILFLLFTSNSFAQAGIYLGLQAGFDAQKPSLEGVEFNTDTTFIYGIRAGVKFLMLALELNYFQAAHNLSPANNGISDWDNRKVDYSFIGLNLKYIFSILMVHPYLTFGYGYYTADIHEIDKDSNGGYNLGLGIELMLGKKFSLSAEGKYNHVKLYIKDKDFGLGDFTVSGGFNIYF